MRHLRAKQGRKTLNYFRIAFGIAPPYAVLLDGNFIHTATKNKIDIVSRIRIHLGKEKFRMFVPRVVVNELRSLGAPVEPALEFALVHCEIIEGKIVGPTEAIIALIGTNNPQKFIVATQEEGLRSHLRSVPGVPLMHIQRTVMLLESPSSMSRQKSTRDETAKLLGSSIVDDEALAAAHKIRIAERSEKRRADGAAAPIPRKAKAKGPNPLVRIIPFYSKRYLLSSCSLFPELHEEKNCRQSKGNVFECWSGR